uniref:Transcriptional-regulating factor 1-like n=1 Tax=Scophthalmus maximus TaxID=52904 RepID=A0A8D3E3I2_SCOMX
QTYFTVYFPTYRFTHFLLFPGHLPSSLPSSPGHLTSPCTPAPSRPRSPPAPGDLPSPCTPAPSRPRSHPAPGDLPSPCTPAPSRPRSPPAPGDSPSPCTPAPSRPRSPPAPGDFPSPCTPAPSRPRSPQHQVTPPSPCTPAPSRPRSPQHQVTPPHLVPEPPHVLAPPQLFFCSQNHDPGFVDPNWTEPEFLYGDTFSFQNQTTSHPHLQNQNQNQFSTGVTHSYGVSGQDPWGLLQPPLSQTQWPPLGSVSGGAALGSWNSLDFSSSSTDDFNSQFLPDSNGPQDFCSPNTPGPSPHYPQTLTTCSPGPQSHHGDESLYFHSQTFTDFSCCPRPSDNCPLTSGPGQTIPHLLLIQDQVGSETSFSPGAGGGGGGRGVSGAAQAPSLPAGPTWTGGGGRAHWTWIKSPQSEMGPKVLDHRLLCTVCHRDFRSLPALNGHMRSHGGGVRSATCLKKVLAPPPVPTSVSMVMPVSVPVPPRGGAQRRGGQRRRGRHLPPATGGAVLYRSMMHLEEEEEEDEVHYTPPPMLCPLRAGPGLYCSLTTRRQQLHHTHNGLIDFVAMETLIRETIEPRINVGQGFQAEVPPLRKYAHSNPQNALLLWTPWAELEEPTNQHRVKALLTMARSSVVPGGAASPDHALHVLSESRGDFLLTVEKLLSTSDSLTGVSWSAAETRLLVQSLQLHSKNFRRVQRAVQTKSLPQCVEFYYLWKKKLSLRVRTPTGPGLTVTLPDTNVRNCQMTERRLCVNESHTTTVHVKKSHSV